jgi:zinc/manganese transport system permease protein
MSTPGPSAILSWLFEPGFLSSSTIRTAIVAGGLAAFTSAVVGLFTVLRRQSFAGHALSDVGTTGGSAAFLVGLNPLWGFVGAALVAVGAIEVVGTRRAQTRDLATGVVFGGALGLAALFLYFDTTHSSTTGATITVLFGSLFVISASTVPIMVGLSAAALTGVILLYRPLLLSTLDPDLAAIRGIPVRLVGAGYLLAMALGVSMSALTIGAVLSTALLIGPPAIALRLVKRPGLAAVVGGCIGVVATWLGILLAYDSYNWPPLGHGWPVSFLVVAIIFTCYLVVSLLTGVDARRVLRRRPDAAPSLRVVDHAAPREPRAS